MLTVSTLPSERKIHVKANLNLDIVIPNLQRLKRKPEKSVIIEIIRDKVDLNKISQMEFLQPNYKNIWLVSAIPLSRTKYPMYGLFPNAGHSIIIIRILISIIF
jgi:hypothetical protein